LLQTIRCAVFVALKRGDPVPYKSKLPPVMATPNVIPMADIMLVLLIIFMVITPMLHPFDRVDMAQAVNAEKMLSADREDAIIVAVTRDGGFFLSPGNRDVAINELGDNVKDLLANRADQTVYVRSDARAKYGDVVKAVDQIRATGVERIGLLTEKIPNKSGPPEPSNELN
jgi:biopolymer transport protein TolR